MKHLLHRVKLVALSEVELGQQLLGEHHPHPVFIHRRFREEILDLDPEAVGLNTVTRGHVSDTVEIAVDDELILEDMDTPGDYARVVARGETAG